MQPFARASLGPKVWLALGALVVLGGLGEWWLGPKPAHSEREGFTPSVRASAALPSLGVPATRPAPPPAKKVTSPAPTAKSSHTPPLGNNLNVLLVGVDQANLGKGGGRPDTIIVASFSEAQAELGLVSIPRDLYVDIPGHGLDRINATFSIALRNKLKPRALLERVVEDTLMLPIAHTVVVDLSGFERAVDALDGVEVLVPCAIDDNFVDSRLPGGRRRLQVETGWQHMDGKVAAMYARSRHGRSDWSRARRQQALLFALKKRALSAAGLARLPRLLNELGQNVATDMTLTDMLGLAPRLMAVEPQRVHGTLIGHQETTAFRTPDGKAVLLPDPVAIQQKLGRLFSAKAPGSLPEHAICPPRDIALKHRPGVALDRAQATLGQAGEAGHSSSQPASTKAE